MATVLPMDLPESTSDPMQSHCYGFTKKNESKCLQKNLTQIFVADLFIIAPNQDQTECPPTRDGMKKLEHVHKRRNQEVACAKTWTNLRSQAQKMTQYWKLFFQKQNKKSYSLWYQKTNLKVKEDWLEGTGNLGGDGNVYYLDLEWWLYKHIQLLKLKELNTQDLCM